MVAMKRHTQCPVHKVAITDVHIKAGSGRVVLLPTFAWRTTPPLYPDVPGSGSPVKAESPSAKLAQLNSGSEPTVRRDAGQAEGAAAGGASPDAGSTRSSLEKVGADAGSGGSSPVRVQSAHGQIEILAAWARIVLELYLRGDSVGRCSLHELRAHAADARVHEEAQAMLRTCLDEV